MMPTGITINILMINTDMIKRAGLEVPKFETSLQELATFCRALQPKLPKGTYAIRDGGSIQEHFQSWVVQKGYQIANEKATDVGFPKEVIVDFHKYWMDLYKAGCVLPIEIYSQPVADMWADDFVTKGQEAMRFTNSNQLKGYQQYSKDDYIIIRNPSMPDGKSKWGDYMRPSALSIAANTKYPDEVAKFISFFVNDMEAIKIFNLELGAIGPAKAAQEMMKTISPKDVLVLKHFEEYAKSAPYKMVDPKGTAAVLTAQRRASDAIRFGGAIEASVDTFMKEAKEAYKVNVT
jgi:multiple sugar transport system substrate-binding protein